MIKLKRKGVRYKCTDCSHVQRTHEQVSHIVCSKCRGKHMIRLPSVVLAKGWKQYTIWFGRKEKVQ